MTDIVNLDETSKEKTFVLDVKKDTISDREYLKELDARIKNLENIFNIVTTRKLESVKKWHKNYSDFVQKELWNALKWI